MDNKKEITYTLTVNMPNCIKLIDETTQDYEKRLLEEGKQRALQYLTGKSYDPEHKVFFEKIIINEQ
jgi:hypothetical protein